MVDYEYRPIRSSTTARIEAVVGDTPCDSLSFGDRDDFEKVDGRWMRVVARPQPGPEFIYQMIYGDFPNAILAVIKLPSKGNWYKVKLPAIKRLIISLGYTPGKVDWYLDGLEAEAYENMVKFPKYRFDGREFVAD